MKYILIVLLVWNLFTFLLMGIDKAKSKHEGARRISESTLLTTAFALGAIGSLLGMVVFHHKTKHMKFIILEPVALIVNLVAFVGVWVILYK